ncbi:NAPDH-dependent diflavin reductase [Gurleya vavrai]
MKIAILYGTQTGNSYEIARIIKNSLLNGYNEFSFYNLDCESVFLNKFQKKDVVFCPMDRFNLNLIYMCSLIIFVCSTHGDGDVPFNMKNFWYFLRSSSLGPSFFNKISYAVYGLGDSSYDKFNYVSKRLFNRMKQLGAYPIICRGDGDLQDENGYFTTFRPWHKELNKAIDEKFSFDSFNELETLTMDYETKQIFFDAFLIEKTYLTPKNYDRPIIQFKFNIQKFDNFFPGDCIAIKPKNYNFKEFLNHNKLENDINNISKNYDINHVPNQLMFYLLYDFCKKKLHYITEKTIKKDQILEKLLEIYKNYDLYYEYVLEPKRSFFCIIKELNIKVDSCFIIQNVPKISPRYFTLTKIDDFYYIYVAVVTNKSKIKGCDKGICSEYLKNMQIGKKISISIEKNFLFFESKKLLFIATGTGISVPWSCLNFFKNKDITIFYGFRYKEKDRLFSDILQNNSFYNENKLIIHDAISKEDKKTYVQEIFKNNFVENIDDYLVFICGNSQLNRDFRKIFRELYGKEVFFQSETW